MARKAITKEMMELYSSAITLSDVEIFIFPELMYSLVLANIMSPKIWAWRDDPWFDGYSNKSPYRRLQRLKQYIIDHYEFNLDLDTWGLTTQKQELNRFEPFIDRETLSRSNALFGYEGDKYYFDIDIRKHFGLDRYNGEVIPYWKTETVEAMDAFALKENYSTGAGECVSLAALYAAALFVVCDIPLDDIFLMATPLHSQNFVILKGGILTNNRRIVTQAMWFNGTELTAKAQRALKNEQVTIVAHHTGHCHVMYPEASIHPHHYERFTSTLHAYLKTHVDVQILINFLRQHREFQSCFQLCHEHHGYNRYLKLETAFHYEHSSSYKIHDKTREKLLLDIDEYEYFSEPIEERICLNQFDEVLKQQAADLDNPAHVQMLKDRFQCENNHAEKVLHMLRDFCHTQPRLPDLSSKELKAGQGVPITPDMGREGIIEKLEGLRDNSMIDLAFYAYRDLSKTDPAPWLKAAFERNPVCTDHSKTLDDPALVNELASWPKTSIYDGRRLAQPDEVWNFRTGDGLERIICLAAILNSRHPESAYRIESTGETARLVGPDMDVSWPTAKKIRLDHVTGRAELKN